MADANIVGGLVGGALIGLASILVFLSIGRIAGISGIFGGLLTAKPGAEYPWRLAFVLGLICGAALFRLTIGPLPLDMQTGNVGLVAAGLLVGTGTRLSAGCTSGHGVCGLGRRSRRSLVATLTFIVVAIVTVFVERHVLA